jgi:competence protein ComEC
VVPPRAPPAASPGAFARSLWQAPLVPVALAGTAGIVLDRYAGVPVVLGLLGAVVGLAAWAITAAGRLQPISLVYLALSIVACGAAYHPTRREGFAPDDLGNFALPEARPVLVRGLVDSEPTIPWLAPNDGLRSFPRTESARLVLQATQLRLRDDWQAVSGLAQVVVAGRLDQVHVGDDIELTGWLSAPQGPANPGEFDYAALLRDQRIRAVIVVKKTPEGVTRRAAGSPWSVSGWLAALRAEWQQTLRTALPPDQARLAVALLLGDSATMSSEEWEKYVRTGVIHVLAISGQHLVVLAAFLWYALTWAGVRRRRGACIVAVFLTAYALLAGGRPPVLRSAVTVCALAGGLVLRRPVLPANSFALAWIVVALVNPTDLFTTGCQLSFLAVAVLYWGLGNFLTREEDPLERLLAESLTPWQRLLRWLVRQVALSYLVTVAIWLALVPVVAARQHVVSPVGLLIGPPAVLLTSVALLSGFLLLFSAPFLSLLAQACAWVMEISLRGCDFLVIVGEDLPGAFWYVGDLAPWWVVIFVGGLLAALTVEALRRRWRWAALAGLSWLSVGLVASVVRTEPGEFRCTFLAVGHGGCTVLETPDGRTLLYDAGALSGPEVTRRQIAPFLWYRGIRRIDEVLLSHADLDHFNGLPALLTRFAVGQVTCTPTFADRGSEGVQLTLKALNRYGVPVRIVRAGDRLGAGEVSLDVLHPPAVGPAGNENARSLVLLVRRGGRSVLLTGDLEGPGLDRVLALPSIPVDVLMAPHHGSRAANQPALAAWAQPRVVVSCQEPPRRPGLAEEPYTERGATFLPTWMHGAVTLRSRPEGLGVETFQTGQRWLVR